MQDATTMQTTQIQNHTNCKTSQNNHPQQPQINQLFPAFFLRKLWPKIEFIPRHPPSPSIKKISRRGGVNATAGEKKINPNDKDAQGQPIHPETGQWIPHPHLGK